MKLKKTILGLIAGCTWMLAATGCQTDVPAISQSPQPESQSVSQSLVEDASSSDTPTPVLLTAETADQFWQVGLTQEEVEGLLAEKAAYEALDEQGKASLREAGGVGCLQFQHLWWEESIALELFQDLTSDAFNEWAKDDQRQKRGECANLYSYAAWRGWTVDDLVEQIEKNDLGDFYPPEQLRVRATVFLITKEQYLAQALKNGLTEEQAASLEAMSYRWEEIAAMTPAQAVQALDQAKVLRNQFNVGELAAQWEAWPQLAGEEKSYVLAAGSGTVNLDALDGWVEDFKNRRPSEVYIMIYGSPLPIAYCLSYEGGDSYTAWYASPRGELSGSYTANVVYKRAFDYLFGAPETEHLKGPLAVPRAVADEQLLSEKPLLNNQKLEALEVAVWDAKARLDGYNQLRDGINGGGTRLPRTQYVNIEYAYHLPGFGPRISLYGQPYQVVVYFQNAEQQAQGVAASSERYAISEDGRRILSQSMVDGSWIPLEDKDEVAITAQ